MRFLTSLGVLFCVFLFCTSTFGAEALKLNLHEHPTLLKMLSRSNELRRQVGLRPHRMSPELTLAAQDQANYMAKTSSFSHYSNGGPWARAIRHRFFGNVRENIAMGQGSVQHVFGTWQGSGGHWASIVSNTTEAGFGYAVGPGGTPYWVAVYGDTPPAKVVKSSPTTAAAPEFPAKPETSAKVHTVAKPVITAQTYSTRPNPVRRFLFRRR